MPCEDQNCHERISGVFACFPDKDVVIETLDGSCKYLCESWGAACKKYQNKNQMTSLIHVPDLFDCGNLKSCLV